MVKYVSILSIAMAMPAGGKTNSQSSGENTDSRVSQPTITMDEQKIWENVITKGIFKKEVVETQIITNLRAKKNSQLYFLHELDDILVMNSRRVSKGSYVSGGRYMRTGFSSSTSNSIGDVVFMYKGSPAITFYQIGDPAGVARLAKAARKSVLQTIKNHQKELKLAEKEASKASTTANHTKAAKTTSEPEKQKIICTQCSTQNPSDAKFCNGCGKALSSTCAKCSKVNAQGASFCAECGLPLS